MTIPFTFHLNPLQPGFYSGISNEVLNYNKDKGFKVFFG